MMNLKLLLINITTGLTPGWMTAYTTIVMIIYANTDYLLAGENVGATKLAKAKELGVKIISENDLMDMI